MRRLIASAFFLFLTDCASPDQSTSSDDTATMLSVVDPRAGKQLTKGFFPLEGQGRWTGRTFTVSLKAPPNAPRKGAFLLLRFGIPESSLHALHTIRISANVDGVALEPESYGKAGEFDYSRDVPAAAFRGRNVTVEFALDKALAPTAGEHRELGVVVTTVGFEAK